MRGEKGDTERGDQGKGADGVRKTTEEREGLNKKDKERGLKRMVYQSV